MFVVQDIIAKATKMLEKNNTENAKQNAQFIVSHILDCTPSQLFLYKDNITKKQHKRIIKFVKKRAKGIPFQYIVGQVEFLNLVLDINKNVLIPRDETEILTEMLINHINQTVKSSSSNDKIININNKNKIEINEIKDKTNDKEEYNSIESHDEFSVLDLCSGSGAIGLSIAKNTNAKVYLSDISAKAIAIAKQNAIKNNISAQFIKSDLFKEHKIKYNLIVSNPPYIKSADVLELQKEVKDFEPHLALDGGVDGYDFYQKIISQAPSFLKPGGQLFFEIGVSQSRRIESLLKVDFENIKKIKDYSNKIRFISASLKVSYDR